MFPILVLSLEVGTLVYIFSISNEHSFVFSSILVLESVCAKLYEFGTLNVLGSALVLFSNVFMCLLILYPGLSFQFTIGHMGLPYLFNFIVPCICGALGFKLMYFHLLFVLIILLHLFIVLCYVLLYFTSNVVWHFSEIIIGNEISSFVVIFVFVQDE
jgi:hypothetical protein